MLKVWEGERVNKFSIQEALNLSRCAVTSPNKTKKSEQKNKTKKFQSTEKNPVFLNKKNITATPFNQILLVQQKESFLRCDIHTDTHTDIATYSGRFSKIFQQFLFWHYKLCVFEFESENLWIRNACI